MDRALGQAREAVNAIQDPVGTAKQKAKDTVLRECQEQVADLPGPLRAAALETCRQAIN